MEEKIGHQLNQKETAHMNSAMKSSLGKPDSLDAVMDLEKSDHALLNLSDEKKELQESQGTFGSGGNHVNSELIVIKADNRLSMDEYTEQLELGQVADIADLVIGSE